MIDYLTILNKYNYPSPDEIIQRIANCEFSDINEFDSVINAIVLWKINRQVKIENGLIIKIKNLQCDNVLYLDKYEDEIRNILFMLLNTKGIKIAMASTILKMFKPLAFPIIDQRAFRTIYKKDLPVYYGKDSFKKYIDLYFQYIKDCLTFQRTNCPNIPFNKIDELLYQIDIEKGNTIKH